ncbi:hypothetical protein LLB_1145 [Legionella longbeachae D-4968]|nr:hypothetical protein LLB_1145 [Legionella longbeachae D-4968]
MPLVHIIKQICDLVSISKPTLYKYLNLASSTSTEGSINE